MRRDRFWLWLAGLVPSRLRYWVCIDAWAKATTGPYGDTVAPDLRVDEMLKRLWKD